MTYFIPYDVVKNVFIITCYIKKLFTNNSVTLYCIQRYPPITHLSISNQLSCSECLRRRSFSLIIVTMFNAHSNF